jgi:hypothetical protein
MKNLITPSFGLDAPLAEDRGFGLNPPGLICAANEARFTASHFNQALTGLVIGWKDPEGIDLILQRLFPEIPTARRFSFRSAKNAEAFLSETDDLRPIGSPFKRVEYSGIMTEARTFNRGLTVCIDHDECDDVEAEVTLTVGRLQQRLRRNSLRRGLALLDASDVAVGAKVWSAATNPDGDLRAMAIASANVTGIFPNVFAIAEAAWHLRLDAYEGATRVNQNRASQTPALLAQYLGADVVEVVKARYQSTATAKAVVLPTLVFAYSAFQGQSKDDPSAVKRFVSAGRAGAGIGIYRKDEDKFTEVSAEHYENIVATGTGIQSIAPAAS